MTQVIAEQQRALRDSEVQNLIFNEGKSYKEVAEQFDITESRVGQILQVGPRRRVIQEYLLRAQDPVTAKDIAVALHMDINQVQFYVDSLRKKGLVLCDIGAINNHRAFVNIRLKYAPPVTHEAAAEPEREPDLDGARRAAQRVLDAEPMPVPVLPEPEPEPEPVSIAPHDVPLYPLLYHLMTRDENIGEAAKLLEAAGLDDIALTALSKQDDFTPLEREYMKYARAHAEAG